MVTDFDTSLDPRLRGPGIRLTRARLDDRDGDGNVHLVLECWASGLQVGTAPDAKAGAVSAPRITRRTSASPRRNAPARPLP